LTDNSPQAVDPAHPLAAQFLACTASPLAAPELEAALRRMVEAGRAAWPAARAEGYIAYVAARATGDLERLHAADLYLACACAGGDEASVTAFDRALLVPLPAIVARNGISRDVATEVVQALRERLFVGKAGGRPLIGDYDGRGALAGWVRVAAVRAASNVRRDETNRAQLVAEGTPRALPVIDPGLALIKRRYGEAFGSAIRDAFAALDAEGRTILRLHFTDGLNLDAIARVIGTSRATAGRRMLAARTAVREETLRLLGERIAATPTELVSILDVVRSTLELSLGALV